MLVTSIVIFCIAAVFGILLFYKVFTNQATPKGVVVAHGLFAAIALGIVIYYVVTNPDKSPLASLAIFLVAALGGFVMVGRDFTRKPVPKVLAVIHAGAAVVGLILLILFVMNL